jgi:hypothetical protein
LNLSETPTIVPLTISSAGWWHCLQGAAIVGLPAYESWYVPINMEKIIKNKGKVNILLIAIHILQAKVINLDYILFRNSETVKDLSNRIYPKEIMPFI